MALRRVLKTKEREKETNEKYSMIMVSETPFLQKEKDMPWYMHMSNGVWL